MSEYIALDRHGIIFSSFKWRVSTWRPDLALWDKAGTLSFWSFLLMWLSGVVSAYFTCNFCYKLSLCGCFLRKGAYHVDYVYININESSVDVFYIWVIFPNIVEKGKEKRKNEKKKLHAPFCCADWKRQKGSGSVSLILNQGNKPRGQGAHSLELTNCSAASSFWLRVIQMMEVHKMISFSYYSN